MIAQTEFKHRLIFITLCLTYIATGILAVLPGASLLQLASNTRVSLEVAGGMFAISSFGFLLGAVLAGPFTRWIQPKYLMSLGLFLLGLGSLITVLTPSFLVLLLGQMLKGLGFGFIDVSLNTIATLSFQENLSENLNNIHGMYGLGALLGPLLLTVGLQFFHSLSLAYMIGAAVAITTMLLALGQRVPALPHKAKEEAQAGSAARTQGRQVFLQGLLWLMILQISFCASAEIGFGNWIVTVVSRSSGIVPALAAPVATAFYIGLTVGRLGGAQLLRRGWLGETHLLYMTLWGGAACGLLVALFPGQLPVAYGASALVGCFYGPLFPGIMAITSRRFPHAIGPVSSAMMIGTGASAIIFPALMGALIPLLGINWVIAIPALLCLGVVLPMALANRVEQRTLQSTVMQHTIEQTAETPIVP